MTRVKMFLAIGSFAVASLFGAAAILLPPQGEVSASANALIAQFLLLCATILGVDIAARYNKDK